MRRGLMHWSHKEVPIATLNGRVQQLQKAMHRTGLSSILAYTSFARPAVVHWFSNFTPYWSEAVLAIPAEGEPVLLAALTPRVHDWIRSVSHLGAVVSSPRLGTGAVDWLAAQASAPERIGVVDLPALPWHIASPLLHVHGKAALVDVGPLYRELRQTRDDAAVAMATYATAIGHAALTTLPCELADAASLASHLEMKARMAGAEEVLIRVSPDLRTSVAPLRLEAPMTLANTYAVELSIAYKGIWVRLGRSLTCGDVPATWQAAEQWFEATCRAVANQSAVPICPIAQSVSWCLETSTDSYPLSLVAQGSSTGADMVPALATGTMAVFSAKLQLKDGSHWYASAPLHISDELQPRLDNRKSLIAPPVQETEG